jgi:hypothetical protein
MSEFPKKIILIDADKANCNKVAEWRSDGGDDLDALGRKLRSARPRSIARHIHVDTATGMVEMAPPSIAKTPLTWEEVEREGYDRIRRSYYRVVRMGGEWFYVSTMQIPGDAVERGWGKAGVAHCRNSRAIVQIVTPLPHLRVVEPSQTP